MNALLVLVINSLLFTHQQPTGFIVFQRELDKSILHTCTSFEYMLFELSLLLSQSSKLVQHELLQQLHS